ncbi:helix-turn-helix domain-containing protein [Falsibacillus albus]|uniref:helix-turn-helix domain-containing protein n=1 Tax=Falsibacillus albus TaxID=2478915 RepID=UPI001314120D|nr:helix-turn-helix domain-containing protein [Falsibacillus albus]
MYKILTAIGDEFESKGVQWLLDSSISNIKVLVAASIKETIDVLENEKPNILIFDMNLMAQDEIEQLKKSIKIMKPHVMTITVEDTFEVAKKAIDLGTSELLIKPYAPQSMVSKVKSLIRDFESASKSHVHPSLYPNQSVIQYKDIFLPSNKKTQPFTMIAIKSEKHSDYRSLFSFVEEYRFSIRPSFLPMDDHILCIFTKKNENWLDEFKRFLASWNEIGRGAISIVIHSGDESSINDRYIEIRKMTEVTFFEGYELVHEFFQPLVWKFIDPFLTPTEQRNWIDWLNQQNMNLVRGWLYDEFLTFVHPYPDPGLLRTRLTSVLAQVRRHMTSHGVNEGELESDYLEVFDCILYAPLIHRIVERLVHFISKVLAAINEKSQISKHHDLIEKSISFMKKNYWNKELDLQIVSDIIQRNPSYLSNLFTRKTGKGFREKLNEIRIHEAKKLLLETELPLKEIAYLCGFQNQQYFSRVFHKQEETSPKMFRMEHAERNG